MRKPARRVPSDKRRAQILRAATELFAKQGFNGTTTRRIAERVGVEETILFRLFPSKRELYWAVIDEKRRTTSGRKPLESQLASETDERKMLTKIARDMLQRNTKDSTLMRLLLFSGLEEPDLSERFFQTYVAEHFEALAGYVRRQIRKGAYRPLDPMLSARCFLGMVFDYSLVQGLFGADYHHKFNIKKVSETLADIWLEGMLKHT